MSEVIDFDAVKGATLAALNGEGQARRVVLLNEIRTHLHGAQQARKSAILINEGYVGPSLGQEISQANTIDACLARAGAATVALMQEWEEQA